LSDRTVRYWLKQGIEEEIKKVKQLKQQIEDQPPFEFEGENIVFYYRE